MDIRKFSNLIEKYKKGISSSREKELLENYLDSFQSNPSEWKEEEMGNQIITEDKIFSGIIRNINKEKNHFVHRLFFSPSLLRRAASIIFFIILGLGILYVSVIFLPKTGPVFWYEKVTSSGEKSLLTLPDGSKVILNADSKLRYPDQFDGKNRKVFLEGEAYFEVRHNSKQPFIVNTGNLTITDLGTKFDVSAYPDNKTITVSLLEGKIKVSSSEKRKIDKVTILKPKEQLIYNKENNTDTFSMFDSLEAVGWKDNIYKFRNEPFGKVLSRLEKGFGVRFKLTNQSILRQKMTVKFENNSLQTVVNVIKNLTGLDYKIVKENNDIKKVLFFRNSK